MVARRMTRRKQAISPLIATLILIAITIVGGIVVYRLFLSSGGAISQNLHATIGDVSVTSSTLTVSVKNDGTFSWVVTDVQIDGPDNPDTGLAPSLTVDLTDQDVIEPGKSSGVIGQVDDVVAGQSYTVSITITDTASGATYVTPAPVFATSG